MSDDGDSSCTLSLEHLCSLFFPSFSCYVSLAACLTPSSPSLSCCFNSSPPKSNHSLPFSTSSISSCSFRARRIVQHGMGGATSKCSFAKRRSKIRELRAKVTVLAEEIKELRKMRELEPRFLERRAAAALACKEEEWEQERRRHEEEARVLRCRIARLEEVAATSCSGDRDWFRLGTGFLVEHMKDEQARRQEAVDKWKQLYLAIKAELDDLIQTTRQGALLYLRAEEGIIQQLQNELKSKEEAVGTLTLRVEELKQEAYRKEREMDILKQSLRILSSQKKSRWKETTRRLVPTKNNNINEFNQQSFIS